MFESMLRNKRVLLRMRERSIRVNSTWPPELNITADDFSLMSNVVSVFQPIRDISLKLYKSRASIRDVLPLFTSAADALQQMDVASEAKNWKSHAVIALTDRIRMILGTERTVPFAGGGKLTSVLPSEFVFVAILNPRYSNAIQN